MFYPKGASSLTPWRKNHAANCHRPVSNEMITFPASESLTPIKAHLNNGIMLKTNVKIKFFPLMVNLTILFKTAKTLLLNHQEHQESLYDLTAMLQ
jgi:hypothetical protein